jgi:hypothetical protein
MRHNLEKWRTQDCGKGEDSERRKKRKKIFQKFESGQRGK